MSKSGKKLSTFERKKFSAKEDSTEASTEKLVQIALTLSLFFSAAPKLLVDFSQQVLNARENLNCLYTCRSLTLPIHGLFKSLALYTWKMLESLFLVLLQSINIPCFHYNSTSQDISKHPHNKNDALEQGSHYSENWFEVFLWTTITILLTSSSHGFFTNPESTNLRIFFMKF